MKTWLEEGEDKSPEDAAKLMFQMVTSSMRAFFDNVGGKNINRKYLENMHKNRKIKLCKINKNKKGYGQIGSVLLS